MKGDQDTLYYFNNCGGRDHVALFGDGAFYDLALTGPQSSKAAALQIGQECVVASRSRHGKVTFGWYSFLREEVLRDDNDTPQRVLFGKHLLSETFTKADAADQPRYSVFFDINGNFKRHSVLHRPVPREQRPTGKKPPVNLEARDLSDDELGRVILEDRGRFPGQIETSSTIAEVRRRRGQEKLRELTLRNYGSKCALCEVSDTQLLVTSHIVGWSERAETRGLLGNAICLCRFHDALFENGYWSLSDDLRVVRPSKIGSPTIAALLPATCSFRRPTSHPPVAEYCRHHRLRHGLNATRTSSRTP